MGVGGREHGADFPEVLREQQVSPVPDVGIKAGGAPHNVIARCVGQRLLQVIEEGGSVRGRGFLNVTRPSFLKISSVPLPKWRSISTMRRGPDDACCEKAVDGHGDVVEETESAVEGAARVMAGRPDDCEGR